MLCHADTRAERYALLVGVGQYRADSGLNALRYAEKDVEELSRLLQASGYRNVLVMTKSEFLKRGDYRYLPVAKHVRGELELLLKDLDQRDDVVVGLAGHGVKYKDDDKSFFCPIDAKLGERQNLIALEDIYSMLRDSRAGRKLLLCDACRNDPFQAGSRAPQSVTRPEAPPPPGGAAALYACSAGERAWEHEDLGHGVFFYFVLQGLRGMADLDEDRAVGMLELAAYVPKRVKDYVRAKYGTRQMPDFQCRVQDFPLVEMIPGGWPSAIFAERQARQHSQDMPLRFVIGSRFENRHVNNDKVEYVIHEWSFLYARTDKEYVLVSVDEVGARVNETLAEANGRGMGIGTRNGEGELVEADWEGAANYPTITDWRVCSIRADEIATGHGGLVQPPDSRFGRGLFFLRMGRKDGKLIPFWLVPHRFSPDKKIIRADTGDVIELDLSMFE